MELDDAAEAGLPDADLAKAVFAAPADTVSDPVQGRAGLVCAEGDQGDAGQRRRPSIEVKDALRNSLLAEKATDLIYDRANKIDNLLANGTALDQLPGDLGLAGVAGTLDAKGNTKDGKPAPIPGGDAERQALIVAAAFQAQKGDPPQLTEVQTLKARAARRIMR